MPAIIILIIGLALSFFALGFNVCNVLHLAPKVCKRRKNRADDSEDNSDNA